MDSKNGRRVRGTVIQRRRAQREAREREKVQQKQREEAMRNDTTHSAEEGAAEKHARTDKSDTEIDTEAGRKVGTSKLYSRHKKHSNPLSVASARQRKSTQHSRALKLLQKSAVTDELLTNQHTATIFTTQPTTTSHHSSNHNHTARTPAATSLA